MNSPSSRQKKCRQPVAFFQTRMPQAFCNANVSFPARIPAGIPARTTARYPAWNLAWIAGKASARASQIAVKKQLDYYYVLARATKNEALVVGPCVCERSFK